MKKPTLEEVKEYFKNAKEVRSSDYIGSQIINIENYSENDYDTKHNGVIWLKDCALWDSTKGYAEIISYKDTYTVSKDFILEAHKDACSTWKTKIENHFPELFPKVELEVGKWYKNDDYPNLVYLEKITENRDIKKEFGTFGIGYGFDFTENPKWDNNLVFANTRNFTLATKEEVETALIAEAKRRGFKEWVRFNNAFESSAHGKNSGLVGCSIRYMCDTDSKIIGLHTNNQWIFFNGKWAEIISEPIEISLDEIAEKFGVDVSLIKIKK